MKGRMTFLKFFNQQVKLKEKPNKKEIEDLIFDLEKIAYVY